MIEDTPNMSKTISKKLIPYKSIYILIVMNKWKLAKLHFLTPKFQIVAILVPY